MSEPKLTHSARLIAQVCDRADAVLDRIEAMRGKPVIGLCDACHELLVEGDERDQDDNGMLLCGKLQGAPDAGPSCLDSAREMYVPDEEDAAGAEGRADG